MLDFNDIKTYLYSENQRKKNGAMAAWVFEGLWKGLSVKAFERGVHVPDSPLREKENQKQNENEFWI